MAKEFLLSSHSYQGRYLYLTCTQEPVAADNQSIIHWTLTVTGGSSNYYTTGPTSVYIAGKQVYYADVTTWDTYRFPAGRGSVSGTLQLPHNPDGSLTVACSLSTAIYYSTVQERRGDWVLEPNPCASTVGATDASIGSVSMVAVGRYNSAYTHTVAYEFGGLQGYLLADGSTAQTPAKLTATSIPFLLPEAFYNQIPNAPSGTCRLTCTTYSGQEQIGQPQAAQFAVTAKQTLCQPQVSGSVVDGNAATVALTGDPAVLVRFASHAQCTIAATARNGATIVQRQIAGVAVESSREIANVEADSVVFWAKDSRGYENSFIAKNTMIPYIKLTANVTAHRENPTSNRVQITVTGNWFGGSFGAQDNALQVSCAGVALQTATGDTTYTATGVVEGVAYDKAQLLQVTARDSLMEVPVSIMVNAGIPVFDWGEKDFRINEDFSVGKNASFEGEIFDKFGKAVQNGLAAYTGNGAQAIDPNTTLEEVILTDHENGPGTHYIIQTFFHNSKNADSNRSQFAIPYATPGPVMHRLRYHGSWSAWTSPLDGLSDYIIATGTDGIWTWEKWASGKAVCWGKRNYGSIAVTTPWGNIYSSDIINEDFPNGLFADIPDYMDTRMLGGEGEVFIASGATGTSAANTGNISLNRPTSKTLSNATIGYYAIGRWK